MIEYTLVVKEKNYIEIRSKDLPSPGYKSRDNQEHTNNLPSQKTKI